MSDIITIRLPGVPVGKGRPRFSRRSGRAYTPEKTRGYELNLSYAAAQVMGDRPLLEGALEVVVSASFPIPQSFSKAKRLDALSGALRPAKKPDPDNLLKTLDALNGVVWHDDAQCVDVSIKKFYADRPCFEVQVRPL